ncbi:MAG TPA: TonB-dependent receptor [Epsilonproteobacteria bacterium]|nr:TonB-dependent receptor [Campylobacterota bacterium]
MTKVIGLSLASMMYLQAAPMELGTIDIEAKARSQVVKDVSSEEIKSADLGEALFKTSPSISLVRRSGIANDVIIRGQKKDNINVTIDGAKVCGACPNRMDPPISHVLTNNIDYIELDEGPFNVEDFGALSSDVKIHTKKPSQKFAGEVSANVGSFGYKKGALSLSGGSESVRFLLSTSTETGEQYKDGNGDNFAQQQDHYIATHPGTQGTGYLPSRRNMDAFSKKTLLTKLFWDITDTQALELSYTANRSDDILYPNTPMDALYDDSDIYNAIYTLKDLGTYSKKLTFNVYQSEVDHPMAITYRKSSKKEGVIKHQLATKMQGAKLKNEFDIDNHALTVGLDYSKRKWDGGFYKNDKPLPPKMFHSIWNAETKNVALFVKDTMRQNKWELTTGLRYDITDVTTDRPGVKKNSYDGLSGNIFATYHADKNSQYFMGVGVSSRVPDGKELYFHKSGKAIGTPDLDKVVNTEADLGAEFTYDDATFKAKLFYSDLKDYIVYNASSKRFNNVDATIWGVELSGTYIATDSLYFDYGVAYQRGKKKEALVGQTDKDLAEIPPLKVNVTLNYDYDETLNFSAEGIASAKWTDFDADNGEQALDAYTVLNLKATKIFAKQFELTVGVDNVFDKTYAVSNTYKDLTLIAGGGDEDVMLLNEPGRYVYANVKYTF